ncbi:lytic polysaccharide monooxygenase [Streptomyces sp. NPDC048845]|uniref:lytic polysaccharide monooxygenase n=1 Tax=Streptomyces sp. NPDC048845 TaxID=3155390 RepID=UPI00341AAEE9
MDRPPRPERPRVPRRLRRLSLLTVFAILPALAFVLSGSSTAAAHGAMMEPGSRTFLCWQDGRTPQGNIDPQNPACDAAVARSGDNSLYNWFSVLRSDGAGRTDGFIPDGQLCSGGNPNFSGFDLPREDWPLTHLTSGAELTFAYNAWAAHPGWFHLYITKDGYDPGQPLGWDDLEPFHTADHPSMTGQVGTVEGQYNWTAQLPEGKTGKHVIYSVWERSDSNETFYNCSDVVFDGGNGEVTGVGDPGDGEGDGGGEDGGGEDEEPNPVPVNTCSAGQSYAGTWSGGYQAEVTVTNTGDRVLRNWMVHTTLPDGQRVDNIWNAELDGTDTVLTLYSLEWNSTLDPGESTTFGYVAAGGTAPEAPHLVCMAGGKMS